MGLAAVALFSTYPAAMESFAHFRWPDQSPGVDRWAQIVLLLGGVQLAYVLYLVQVPDWSTTWVVMMLTVVIAVMYATGLGMTALAGDDNGTLMLLGLDDEHRDGYAAPWCFAMLILMCGLAYFFYRVSVRWHKTYLLAGPGGE